MQTYEVASSPLHLCNKCYQYRDWKRISGDKIKAESALQWSGSFILHEATGNTSHLLPNISQKVQTLSHTLLACRTTCIKP